MRIESLTVLRFVAALIVVNFHFGRELMQWPAVLIAGPEMVTFFFVLSGFVMGYTYLQKQDHFSAPAYWRGRFRRIAPAYYVALLMSLVVLDSTNMLSIALGALLLQSWIPPYAHSLNVPAWSVSVEAFFYLVFPAIVYGIRRFRLTVLQVCLGACAFWWVSESILFAILRSNLDVQPPSDLYYLINFAPLTYVSGFCLGVAGGMWFITRSQRDSWGFTALAVFTLGLIAYVVSSEAEIQAALGLNRLQANSLSPLFLVLIVSIAQGRQCINDCLSAAPLIRLGNASYAMYIFQLPLWVACRRLFPTMTESPVAFMLLYLTVLIGASLLFSRYIDAYFSKPKAIKAASHTEARVTQRGRI